MYRDKVVVCCNRSTRHDVFEKYLATKYPESFDAAVPEDLIYSGQVKRMPKILQ
jgi:phosphoribosylformylglycinamidine cyclo-ligase